MNCDKKILVLDIDGTLVNSKKEITPKTLEALIKIQEEVGKINFHLDKLIV